jgi:hypothetical protein
MSIDTDHIDALVKEADPAHALSQVGPDSSKAGEIWERVLVVASLGTSAPPFSRPRPRRDRWLILPALSVGAVAAVVILVLQLLPTPALRAPSASAAVLRHLAEKAAAVEPTPVLKDDQWIQSEFRVSFLAAPPNKSSKSAALHSARAVVTGTAESWANDLTQYCSQQVVTSVVYNSAASQQAWLSNGVGVPSTPQPGCGSGFLGGQGSGTFDVAKLPTHPAALAEALERGTTGIAALDELHSLTPFGRAVELLVGPTLGATPALWSALLRAMATMPGVALLGTETTHSGATGVTLAGATGQGYRTTIILSPSTGALLEARNLLIFQPFATLSTIGVLTIQWLDPVGTPQVVDASMLPSSLAGQVPTGIVSAVTKPGAFYRWEAWLGSVFHELPGKATSGAAVTSTPGVYGVSVVTYTPDPDLARIKELFMRSGLVHAIRSAEG